MAKSEVYHRTAATEGDTAEWVSIDPEGMPYSAGTIAWVHGGTAYLVHSPESAHINFYVMGKKSLGQLRDLLVKACEVEEVDLVD